MKNILILGATGRIAVAHLIYDLVVNEEGINESLGVTN